MLNFLLSQSTARGIEVRPDPARFRPSDIPVLRGSYEKIERAVGWRPQIQLERTLVDVLEYWRRRIRPRAQ
jgi:GDP-4-dehydro-6-deoxy-D-mannose reductase